MQHLILGKTGEIWAVILYKLQFLICSWGIPLVHNNIYLLRLGCHPVALVILHVKKNMKLVTTKFKSEGLHEKHVEATWNPGNHLSICF